MSLRSRLARLEAAIVPQPPAGFKLVAGEWPLTYWPPGESRPRPGLTLPERYAALGELGRLLGRDLFGATREALVRLHALPRGRLLHVLCVVVVFAPPSVIAAIRGTFREMLADPRADQPAGGLPPVLKAYLATKPLARIGGIHEMMRRGLVTPEDLCAAYRPEGQATAEAGD